ncbi:MAG: hypothetical protein E7642_01900 [Ruminococcaceae bacterium]|nr:hypothetical protein [Oscillospiraceae bacterium]
MKNNMQIKQDAANNKSVKWFAFVRPTLLLLITVFLFTYVSFAWMRREWTPYVAQDGITIATGGSLAFQLDENAEVTTVTTINDILKVKNFVLKPVSNLNGKSDSFFALDLQKAVGQETYEKLNVSDYGGDYTKMGVENGYIEFQLMLYSADSANKERYVYIDCDEKSGSYIRISDNTPEQAQVLECIRVSLTTKDGRTWIFAPEIKNENGGQKVTAHQGVNLAPKADGTGYLMDGVKYYDNYDPEAAVNSPLLNYGGQDIVKNYVPEENTTDMGLHYFSDYSGKDENGNSTEKALFQIHSGEATKEWLTIRIWAEGTHGKCDKLIAGSQIDLKLKFSSFTVDASSQQ